MTPARLRWKHLNTDPGLAGTIFVATVFGVILSFFGSAAGRERVAISPTELSRMPGLSADGSQRVQGWLLQRLSPMAAGTAQGT